jgi:major membrane immunogen (membrane-anchored lipoprotein)
MVDVTIKGIPVEKLLEVYEKYEGSVDRVKSRDAKYRDAHREERNKKAREYYQRRKEAQKSQAAPETQAEVQATPEK